MDLQYLLTNINEAAHKYGEQKVTELLDAAINQCMSDEEWLDDVAVDTNLTCMTANEAYLILEHVIT